MEIFKKIPLIMKEIGPIAKDRKNAQQGYNFRGVDDLMNAFGPVAAKHGVFPVCIDIQTVISESVTSAKGAQGWRQKNKYFFMFYAEDGSNVSTMAEGEAIDYGDKGANKAYSVAYREAIFKTFVIPFENEDIETTSHELTAVQEFNREDRERIKQLLVGLGRPIDTKSQVELAVKALTKLPLTPENAAEIITRLTVLVEEADPTK